MRKRSGRDAPATLAHGASKVASVCSTMLGKAPFTMWEGTSGSCTPQPLAVTNAYSSHVESMQAMLAARIELAREEPCAIGCEWATSCYT